MRRFPVYQAEETDVGEIRVRSTEPALFQSLETAKYVLQVFMSINDQMDESIRSVENKASKEEYNVLKTPCCLLSFERSRGNRFGSKASATRVVGAEGSNRSGSFTWAGKQEKLRSMQLRFFLTAPLIELFRNWRFGCAITTDLQNKCLNEVFDPATQRALANFQPMPEVRRRGCEFKRNITARRMRRNGHDDALLRLIVSLVRYHYSLARLDATGHQDQSASSIDGDGKGFLVKRIAT